MAGRASFTHFVEEEFAEHSRSWYEATAASSRSHSMFAVGLASGRDDAGIFSWYDQSVSLGSGFMAEQQRHRATHLGCGAAERTTHVRFESIPPGSGYRFQGPPLESIPLPCFLGSFSSSSASAQPHERATEPANSSTDVPVSGAYTWGQPRDGSSSGAWPWPLDEHATVLTGSPRSAHVPGQVLHPSGQPSLGSMFHASGTCLPCRFYKHPDGCKVGASCDYCHHPHDDWSLSKTQKFFRKHVAAYLAYHGLRGEGSE